jgi:hypothetical protein
MLMEGFDWALRMLKMGYRVRRAGWRDAANPHGKWVELDQGDAGTMSHLVIRYPEGHPRYPGGATAPWTPTRCDLLESDWMMANP